MTYCFSKSYPSTVFGLAYSTSVKQNLKSVYKLPIDLYVIFTTKKTQNIFWEFLIRYNISSTFSNRVLKKLLFHYNIKEGLIKTILKNVLKYVEQIKVFTNIYI